MNRQQYDKLIGISEELGEVLDFVEMPSIWRDAHSVDYMPAHPWGTGSTNVLLELHPDLVYLCNKIADVYDVSLLWGYRNEAQQTAMYENGTGLPWPTSNHNVRPSRAVDIVPYPVDWLDIPRFDMMLGAAEAIAQDAGIGIRLGKYFSNRKDYPHIELI